MGGEERKQNADPGIHKIPVPIRNSAILPFRSDRWSSAEPRGRSAWVAINAKRTARQCEIHDTTVDGRRREKNKTLRHRPLKFRRLFVIPLFYRPAAFSGVRGFPGGVPRAWPLTPNAQRGNDK